ncbi:MAG TPA: hypothetical protein VKH46_11100 [Thermoanaerobaculia bacterium]|jgi:anti-sigma factor RsiW|nr:hypothetical protein [Thermoanaerobaculia bacterium]
MNRARPFERHLADGDFFLLAFPPAGEPEPLPAHLAGCDGCARRFAQWQRAAREIAGRPAASGSDFERAVMAKIRALPAPRRRRARRSWALAAGAAAAVAAAFWLGARTSSRPAPPLPEAAAASMGARDLADDALLRDVSRLVEGEETEGWKRMAPLPEAKEGRS